MKEITRIHIAKTAYDIELAAKKELEAYMAELEKYAGEAEILQDIELRITELLEERHVVAGGVIAVEDVTALRSQLGEPQEFADTADEVHTRGTSENLPRRLYRDEDGALLGGVLAGGAKYLNVHPAWMRLVFLLVAFASFGTAFIVYVVMWIIVPPARTATEKLTLEGKATTLAAIKERSAQIAQSPNTRATARVVRDVLLFCVGLVCMGVAVLSLLATIAGGLFLLTGGISELGGSVTGELFSVLTGYQVAASVLFIVSGMLFTALSGVLAMAAFRRVWTRRIGISVVAIVAAGIVTFATAFVPLVFGVWQADQTMRQSYVTTQHELPESFASARQLSLDMGDMVAAGTPVVVYTVSDSIRYEIKAPDSMTPELEVTQKGAVATMSLSMTGESTWRHYQEPVVHMYGPALDSLVVSGGTMKYVTTTQDKISFDAKEYASILADGVYESVVAKTEDGSSVLLDRATVNQLDATTRGGSIEAGVVRDLKVVQPTSCPVQHEDDDENTVEVSGVTSRTLSYNGVETPLVGANGTEQPCGRVEVDSE